MVKLSFYLYYFDLDQVTLNISSIYIYLLKNIFIYIVYKSTSKIKYIFDLDFFKKKMADMK